MTTSIVKWGIVSTADINRKVIPGAPVHVEYSLTDKGGALADAIEALAAWAERWATAGVAEA